jgi:MFS transporter, PPP family, 3-phenylpropionic acid transporter
MKRVVTRELVSVIATVSLAIMAMSILTPVLPLFLKSIGVSPTVLGLMFSVGMVGMVFGESSAGWLADKIGVRIPLGIGTIACIPLVLCFAFTSNVPFIFTIFLTWGVVRAAVFGPGRGYIGANVPFSHKATYMAVFAASTSVCGSIGSFLGGFIGDHLGYDWNFYIAAGIELAGGALVLCALRKIPYGKPALPLPVTSVEIRPAVKAPYRSRNFLSQCVIAAFRWASIGVISPFLPLVAVDIVKVDTTAVGILFTISSLVNAVLLIPVGRLSDHKNKKGMMIIGLLVTAVGMAGIAFSRNYPVLIASVIVESAGGAIFNPAAVALLSEAVPSNWQNTAMGLYGGCEDIGVVAGSALGGVVWSSLGATSAFLILGTAMPIISAVVAFTLLKAKPGSTPA